MYLSKEPSSTRFTGLVNRPPREPYFSGGSGAVVPRTRIRTAQAATTVAADKRGPAQRSDTTDHFPIVGPAFFVEGRHNILWQLYQYCYMRGILAGILWLANIVVYCRCLAHRNGVLPVTDLVFGIVVNVIYLVVIGFAHRNNAIGFGKDKCQLGSPNEKSANQCFLYCLEDPNNIAPQQLALLGRNEPCQPGCVRAQNTERVCERVQKSGKFWENKNATIDKHFQKDVNATGRRQITHGPPRLEDNSNGAKERTKILLCEKDDAGATESRATMDANGLVNNAVPQRWQTPCEQ